MREDRCVALWGGLWEEIRGMMEDREVVVVVVVIGEIKRKK